MRIYNGPRFRVLHFCTDHYLNDALAQMDLTASQGRIMGYIARQSVPPCAKDIEEHFHLTHPSVSGILRRLEKKEFIAFRPDENDRRCKRIHVLPKGTACNEQMERAIARIEARIVADFTAEEQAQFTRLLDRAIQNIGANLCDPIHKEETQ